jgi:hypothetical protein
LLYVSFDSTVKQDTLEGETPILVAIAMAKCLKDFTLKYQGNKSAPIEEVAFKKDMSVDIAEEWQHFYLIRDQNGRYYNVSKDWIEKTS